MPLSKIRALGVVVVVMLAWGATAMAEPSAVRALTLKNGLKVLFEEDHRRARVAVSIAYGAGLRDDPPGYGGLAHLTEHLMFAGSRNVGRGNFFRSLARAGATRFQGEVHPDSAVYYEEVPARNLATALWLESDRMAFLLDTLNDESVEREVKIVENEHLEKFLDSQWSNRAAVVSHLLFPEGHPYHGLGENLEIDGVELRHVQWFFQTHYRPDNATLAIVGDFVESEAENLVRHYFEGVVSRGRAPPRVEPPVVTLDAERNAVVRQRVRYEGLIFAWPGPPERDSGSAALGLVAACLAGRGSALERALVTRGGSALQLGAHQLELADQSLFLLEALASYEVDVAGIRQAFESAVSDVQFDVARYCAIDSVRDKARAALLDSMDHFANRARYLAKTGHSLADRLAALEKLTADDVEITARRYLASSRRLAVELRWQSSPWGTFKVSDE